jgi:hypothetical protein
MRNITDIIQERQRAERSQETRKENEELRQEIRRRLRTQNIKKNNHVRENYLDPRFWDDYDDIHTFDERDITIWLHYLEAAIGKNRKDEIQIRLLMDKFTRHDQAEITQWREYDYRNYKKLKRRLKDHSMEYDDSIRSADIKEMVMREELPHEQFMRLYEHMAL